MDRSAALDAARKAVADRATPYGKPEDNFERIARLWSAHLDNANPSTCCTFDFNSTDVAIMLALVKIARLEAEPQHADSWIDGAGYMACGAEVSGAIGPPPDHPVTRNSDLVDDVAAHARNQEHAATSGLWHFGGR